MPIAMSAEQRALQASIREWAEGADTLALVRLLEPCVAPGAAPDEGRALWDGHWSALAGLGVFSIALPQAAGGDGGTVADLATALALSARQSMPAHRCLTAWNEPIGRPNWCRVWA